MLLTREFGSTYVDGLITVTCKHDDLSVAESTPTHLAWAAAALCRPPNLLHKVSCMLCGSSGKGYGAQYKPPNKYAT